MAVRWKWHMRLLLLLMLCGCDERRTDPEPSYRSYEPPSKPKFEPSPGADANWWCSDALTQVVTCDRLRSDCDTRRRKFLEGYVVDKVEPCEPQEKAACFSRKHKLSGKTETTCYPDFTRCRNVSQREMRDWVADWDVLIDCKAQ